jgi:hypothetical protein
VPLHTSEWADLRRYDPRRIVRDALDDDPTEPAVEERRRGELSRTP